MKKIAIVLSLLLFTGSMATAAVNAVNGTNVEIKKEDDKKKKKKKKKSACCSSKKGAEKSCCAKKKQCGSKKDKN
ncbi:MAG: hypothetical protein EP338_08305 [Bacteroidetes bacterium]|nr:MAG: hypothetical protein EP338_08305 [Bacteroidota bacterium]